MDRKTVRRYLTAAGEPFKDVFAGGSVSGVVCYAVTAPDVARGVMLTLDSIEGERLLLATSYDLG